MEKRPPMMHSRYCQVMGRATYPVRTVVLSLLIAGVSGGQERDPERAKSESARLRQAASPSESDVWKHIKAVRDRSADFHAAIRIGSSRSFQSRGRPWMPSSRSWTRG